MRWQDAFDHAEQQITERAKGRYSRLGVTYVRAAKPELRLPLPGSDRYMDVRQDIARGLSAVVWDCALAMCEFLATYPETVQNKAVWDFGCGTGACGRFAAAIGASSVLLTDCEAPPEQSAEESEQLKFVQHDWNEDCSEFASCVDVILCSDLLYNLTSHERILQQLVACMQTGVQIIIAHKCRDLRKEKAFFEAMDAVPGVQIDCWTSEHIAEQSPLQLLTSREREGVLIFKCRIDQS